MTSRSIFGALALVALGSAACGKSESDNPLKDVSAIVVLKRTARVESVGNVFNYTSYAPGAKLIKLSPPAADGVRTTLCCDQWPEYSQVDIQSYDISFDARSIVFSARLTDNDHYQLYILTLGANGEAAGPPTALPTNPMRDYVYPIWAPRDRIVFVTNDVVEAGAQQHQDEYERETSTQLGFISKDGLSQQLGPRNLSHRVAPTMMADGSVLFTQWDHLGEMNDGHLMMVNPDMTRLREAFGKEGDSQLANSYLKAIEMEPGRMIAIGTSRDRTIQSGALLDIHLNKSEATATATNLTPMVPLDRVPSFPTVGRYYDAYPVKVNGQIGAKPVLLVSWADGPVEERTLAAAGLAPDFGVYLFDSASGTRLPVFNDAGSWEIEPRILAARPAPAAVEDYAPNQYSSTKVLVGAFNVYNSTKFQITPGSVVKVKIIEGFSVEEGIPMDFGLTEDEGAAQLGEATVYPDGSFAALVPANIPIHLQLIDKHDMVAANETVWFSGRPGESRMCGGCHEDRANSTPTTGLPMALTSGPLPDFDKPRAARRSTNFTRGNVVGIPWDGPVQKVFNDHCISCHDGVDHGDGANPMETFVDSTTGQVLQTFRFNLKGDAVNLNIGGEVLSGYSASHLSLLGTGTLELSEKGVTVQNPIEQMVLPKDPIGSPLFKYLNAPQMFPYDTSPGLRFQPGVAFHTTLKGVTDLSEDEWYLLLNMVGNGGQFYSRENAPY